MRGLEGSYGESAGWIFEPQQWVRWPRESLLSDTAVPSPLGILDLEELAGEAEKAAPFLTSSLRPTILQTDAL